MEIALALIIFVASLICLLLGLSIGKAIGAYKANKEWEKKLPELRQESIDKSRQVLGGKLAENLSPYFPDFKYDPTEIRFIGAPVDYIVFKGISKKEPEEIVFLEIKSGNATLSDVQRKLKKLVDEKKVSWDEYRVKSDVTNK